MGFFSKIIRITKGGIEYYVIGIEAIVSRHIRSKSNVRVESIGDSMVGARPLAIEDEGTVIV